MDEEWKQTLEDFSRVWPRVEGKAPPPPPEPGHGPPPPPPGPGPGREDAETLERLMEMEARAERRYALLARMTRGRASETLRRLAAGNARTLKQLQREYYLRTGDSYPVPQRPMRPMSLQEGLRRAWNDAGARERACRDAANETRDEGLREIYIAAAESARRERQTLRELAGRMFR